MLEEEIDKAVASIAERARCEPVPWDDLKERRALQGVRAVIARDGEERGPSASRRRRPGRRAALGAGAAACVIVGVAASLMIARPAPDPDERARITLADGSRAVAEQAADLRILEQGPDRVRLAQRSGFVRYEVEPRPDRSAFVVETRGAELRVLGTVFEVRVTERELWVRVEHGRVEVRQGERRALLEAGDELRSARDPSPPAPAPEDALESALAPATPEIDSVEATAPSIDSTEAPRSLKARKARRRPPAPSERPAARAPR